MVFRHTTEHGKTGSKTAEHQMILSPVRVDVLLFTLIALHRAAMQGDCRFRTHWYDPFNVQTVLCLLWSLIVLLLQLLNDILMRITSTMSCRILVCLDFFPSRVRAASHCFYLACDFWIRDMVNGHATLFGQEFPCGLQWSVVSSETL